MKKNLLSFVLTLVFVSSMSVSAFADGEIPTMGKTCPPNTTCLVGTQTQTEAENATVLKTVIDYLTQLFG